MSRFRPHVNPHKVFFLDRRVAPLELPADRDVEVELGCAEAQFLFALAEARPDVEPIGLEIRGDLVAEVNDRARKMGSRVRVIFCHANYDFETLFAPGSLARIYVNFPDPWYKRRHRNRRVMDARLATAMARALRPGGDLFFQSDVWHIALDALAVLEDAPGLRNLAGPWTFWKSGNPYGIRSRREEGCEDEGLPIWRIRYVASTTS